MHPFCYSTSSSSLCRWGLLGQISPHPAQQWHMGPCRHGWPGGLGTGHRRASQLSPMPDCTWACPRQALPLSGCYLTAQVNEQLCALPAKWALTGVYLLITRQGSSRTKQNLSCPIAHYLKSMIKLSHAATLLSNGNLICLLLPFPPWVSALKIEPWGWLCSWKACCLPLVLSIDLPIFWLSIPPAAFVPEQGPPVAIRHLPVLNALRTMRTKATHAGNSTKGAAPREATWIFGAILTNRKYLIRWVLVFNKPKDISQVCDKGLRAVCTVHSLLPEHSWKNVMSNWAGARFQSILHQ